METKIWPLIAFLIAILLLVALISVVKKGKRLPPDYRAFFFMGLFWLAFGLPYKNYALAGMGAIFMIIGLWHKKDWQANRKQWQDLGKRQKIIMTAAAAALGFLVAAGIIVFILVDRGLVK